MPSEKSQPSSPWSRMSHPWLRKPLRKTTAVWIRLITHLSKSYFARDLLQTALATAALCFYLNIHLDKEDTHLNRIFKERVSLPEQGKAIGIMSSMVPKERFPELVAWMFPLMGHDDHENMTRIWQMVMPAPAFAGAKNSSKRPSEATGLNSRVEIEPILCGGR
jgi:hypothetical protein